MTTTNDNQQAALSFDSTGAMRLIQAVAEAVQEAQTQRGGLAYKAPTFLHELHKRGFTVTPRAGFIFLDTVDAEFREVDERPADAGASMLTDQDS